MGTEESAEFLSRYSCLNPPPLKYPALYVSEFFEKSRQNYFDSLRTVSDNKAWHEWINYFLEAITRQAIKNTKRAKSII